MSYVDNRQRAVGANYVARQGKRLLPMAVFIVWLGVGRGGWPSSLGVESVWARLAGFYLAFVLYWVVGWWCYTRKYGSSRGSVPTGVGEIAPWVVAVAMMTAALCGEGGGLVVALMGLAATAAGAMVMVRMMLAELFGRSWTHVIALSTVLMTAAMLQAAPSALVDQASLSLALIVMGAGLAICGPVDSFGLIRDLECLSGRSR